MTEDKESQNANESKSADYQESEKQTPHNINSTEGKTGSSMEGGNKTMAFASIAIIISVIAIAISLIILFTSEKGQKETKNEFSEKLNSAIERIKMVENKLIEAENEGRAERTGRGLLELKKALLSFQEARTLIRDDELINKLLKIENEMKSLITLPEPNDIDIVPDTEPKSKIEGKDFDVVVNGDSETTSQITESEELQEDENVAEPIMGEDSKPEDEGQGKEKTEMNETGKSDAVVNDGNLR